MHWSSKRAHHAPTRPHPMTKRKNAVMIGRRIVMLTKAYAATEAVFPLPRRIPAQTRACPAGKFTTAQISIAMPLIASASGSEE